MKIKHTFSLVILATSLGLEAFAVDCGNITSSSSVTDIANCTITPSCQPAGTNCSVACNGTTFSCTNGLAGCTPTCNYPNIPVPSNAPPSTFTSSTSSFTADTWAVSGLGACTNGSPTCPTLQKLCAQIVTTNTSQAPYCLALQQALAPPPAPASNSSEPNGSTPNSSAPNGSTPNSSEPNGSTPNSSAPVSQILQKQVFIQAPTVNMPVCASGATPQCSYTTENKRGKTSTHTLNDKQATCSTNSAEPEAYCLDTNNAQYQTKCKDGVATCPTKTNSTKAKK